jgi:hypothetical protein
MQRIRQLKDSLKDLTKVERKEVVEKRCFEISQSKKRARLRYNLRKNIKKNENIINTLSNSSFFETIPQDNFTFARKKYWKQGNLKMRFVRDKKYLSSEDFFFEIYLPNFFNKTRFQEALKIVFEKNKQNIINKFLTRIEGYKQELLILTNK